LVSLRGADDAARKTDANVFPHRRLQDATCNQYPRTYTAFMAAEVPLPSLIEASARGDHGSFSQLYERTHLHLFGIAIRLLRSEQQAEDAVQDAFVKVWNRAGSYRAADAVHEGHALAWLTSIVRNRALDMLRARSHDIEDIRPGVADGDDDDEGPSAAGDGADDALDLYTKAAQALHVDGCMGLLDASQRQCLALTYFQGLSNTEVADHLGAPLGSVKAWIRRGLMRLKDCLATQGVMA
jgi:RNA polymerase sigma-70 factor, ECF subfamily